MQRKQHLVLIFVFLFAVALLPRLAHAKATNRINAKSAIVIDMESGNVLFEQNADLPIAPASITKILTLYLVFEAIKEGQVHLSDKVEVSRRAASTGGSRMGLKANTRAPLEEVIKGMAVVSGNDACVAAAEHISGSVERFVVKMNAKARELGMTNTRFVTPNGLPAGGQITTARDIAKLSTIYLRRFPESLSIHSLQSYTYGRSSHHNANRLLGKCAGVDGLKTGFVCSSGYNISATAKRGGTRILAVVMGARTPWIRLAETEKLIEAGFRECGAPHADVKFAMSSESDAEIEAAPAARGAGPGAAGFHRKKGKTGLARIAAMKSKKPAASSLKPGKNGKTVKTAAAVKTENTAVSSTRTAKKTKSLSKSRKAEVKYAQVKSSNTAQQTKSKKSIKSAKSTGKQPAKKATAGKKASTKTSPHANDFKKKPKG